MKKKLLLGIIVAFSLAPMLVFGQTVIQVEAGVDSIAAALAKAVAGDIIELTTSGGIYNETATTVISFPVTIRAAEGLAEPPVWTSDNDSRQITLSSDLDLDGITFDGSLGASITEDCIRIDDAVHGQNLKINNCLIQKFDNGLDEGHGVKGGGGTQMDSLIVTNTMFAHMMHEHISFKDESADLPPGSCLYLWVENTTFWDGMNEAIYFQASDAVSDNTPDPECYITNVTLVSMGSKGLYPNQIDGAVIKNSIVINSSSFEYACRIYGLNSKVDGLLYWNCPSGIGLEQGATEAQLSLIQAEVDPMMADVANGDFTLAPNSPAVGAGVDGVTLGDPRWYPPKVIQVEAGVDSIAAALAKASAGDIIELTTSGGIYNETATTVISFPVTIRAADGLAEPPVWTSDNNSRQITLSSDLDLDGITFDGSLGASITEDCIRIDDAVHGQNLKINNCLIQKFDNGLDEGHGVKGGGGTQMASLIVTNTMFAHMMHEHISFKDESADLPPGSCLYLWVENTTFWDGMNEAIYFQASDAVSDSTPDPECYITNVTLVSMGSKGLYPNQIDGAVIKNSIVINSSSFEFACRIYGLNSRVDGLLYWNCPSGINLREGATEAQLSLIQAEVDPMMADVANGDFTLAPNSPAVGAGVDGVTLGDPRWWPTGTSVEDANVTKTPYTYQLNQNYPNPFNPSTTINFSIAEAGKVVLTIFNTLGQEVETLVDEQMRAGKHTVTWSAADHSTGVYFYKVKVNEFESIKKMLLIK